MKKYNNIICIICLAIIFASCNDWLDVKPTDELDRSELFKSEKGYSEALTGVYANMSKTNLYGRTLTWYVPDLLAGYFGSYPVGGSISYWTDYPYKHDDSNVNSTAVEMVDGIWSNMYNQIANLNSILSNIDKDKNIFSNSNYDILKGEAIGLRAFLHFDLLRMFAEPYEMGKDKKCIPFVDELSTDVFPLLTEEQVLDIIIKELKEARELLGSDPLHLGTTPDEILASQPSDPNNYSSSCVESYHNRRFKFNYYAATAMLARVYLWKGDKTNALVYAKEIIADQEQRFPWVVASKLSKIGSVNSSDFYQDRTFATEHIFAMNEETLQDYIDGWMYAGENYVDSNQLSISYAGYNFYDNQKDIRFQYLINQIGYYQYSSKYYQNSVVLNCFQKRIPLIRVSEMYYIAAECEPNAADGMKWINKVLEHRGLADSTVENASDLPQEITKEYQKEFLGEGQLWFYYKRNILPSIPNVYTFSNISLYTFDRPSNEDYYGGHTTE